jgi:hypothetical protein
VDFRICPWIIGEIFAGRGKDADGYAIIVLYEFL